MYPDIVKDIKTVHQGSNFLVGEITTTAGIHYTNEFIGKFDGLNALFEYQREYQKTAKQDKSSDNKKSDSYKGFYHFPDFKTAVDTYLHNPSSVSDFKALSSPLTSGDSAGLKLAYDVTGDSLDIGKYLEGDPEVFSSLTDGNPRGKRVNILVNMSWSAVVDKDVINERSKRLIRLIDWLEGQHIRTQVIAVDSNKCMHLELIVKRFDEPLVISDIAIIGHSDFLRRVIFRLTEYSKTFQSGYGSALTLNQYFLAHSQDFNSPYNNEFTLLVLGGDRSLSDIATYFNDLETELTRVLAEQEESRVMLV